MDILYYTFTITCLILLMNYDGVKSQSISLQGSGEAIQGEEYTLECITTSQQTVNWYQGTGSGTNQIAWSNNNYNQYNNSGCGFYSQIYRNYYMFKDCGVKHKLTIKSIDYNRDNGKRWICVIYDNGDYISSNRVTVSVTYPVVLRHQRSIVMEGSSFILRCESNISNVKWYRGNQELSISYTGRSPDGCQHGSTFLYQFKRCGITNELAITSIDYNRDNGSKFQCRAGSYQSNTYTLQANVLPKFIISTTPVHGESFDMICKSTYTVYWYRKASGEGTGSFIGFSSVDSNGCSVQSGYNSDYKFKSCGSVNQILTIKSVDFNRDNGKVWTCFIKTATQFSDSYSMVVTVPVSSVDITSTDLNLSTITVEENQQISIQCVTSFTSPEPVVDLHVCNDGSDGRCNIYRTTKYSENKTSIIFQVTLNSTLEIDDTRLYCTANNTDTKIINSSSITLYILHHPRVRVEEDEGKLLCIAVGRPENMTFLPWKHSIDNKLVREIEGYYINTTVYSLNITNNQNNDGNYTCTVNNGISDPSTKQLNQIAYYKVNLKVQPNLYNIESNNNLVIGQNGEISLKYLEDKTVNVSWYTNDTNLQTNPLPSLYGKSKTMRTADIGDQISFIEEFLDEGSVNVLWTSRNQQLKNASRITIREEPTEISHPYNKTIKLSGIKSILTITSIVITDQGNYTCQVCNQYGCSSKTFEMDVVSTTKRNSEDDGNENMTVIVVVVVSILAVVLLLVGVFIIIKYRKYKASKRDENRLYDSTVPTPATIYGVIGTNGQDNEASEYDRTVPSSTTQESNYTTLCSNNPYVNDQTLPVYYNTKSDASKNESQNIIIGSDYVN